MKAYIFPGQGSQYPGMGMNLYKNYPDVKEIFDKANEILGFNITDIMFNGSTEELKQTKIAQPAIFIHSVALIKVLNDKFKPDMVAGHSLGEFSALVANGVLTFEDALKLVSKRAEAMQKACEKSPSTMAAILGLDEIMVEDVCSNIEGIVVPANYNSPGQIVISGEVEAVKQACEILKDRGAKRTIILQVAGAFHSLLMLPAKEELASAINNTPFYKAICPIYQNVNAKKEIETETIKSNLISQLTSAVLWTQTIKQMINDGASEFIETGPGKVLSGLVKKINNTAKTVSAEELL